MSEGFHTPDQSDSHALLQADVQALQVKVAELQRQLFVFQKRTHNALSFLQDGEPHFTLSARAKCAIRELQDGREGR